MAKAAEAYALGPTRVQHQNRDPRGWREFADQFAEHSTEGAVLTMRGVQKRRPSLFEMPNAGNSINLEDPAAFNADLSELFAAADAGTWPVRDSRAMAGSILGR